MIELERAQAGDEAVVVAEPQPNVPKPRERPYRRPFNEVGDILPEGERAGGGEAIAGDVPAPDAAAAPGGNPPKRPKLVRTSLWTRFQSGLMSMVGRPASEEEALDCFQAIEPQVPKRSLHSEQFCASVLSSLDPDYERIMTYVKNSASPTPRNMGKVRVERILKLSRTKSWHYDLSKSTGLRMMLWHGEWNRNLPQILDRGLAFPANRKCVSNWLPGQHGIYFSDRIARSVKFCEPHDETPKFLFLSDVFLGEMADSRDVADYKTRDRAPEGFHSVRVEGAIIPREDENVEIDECIWPLGQDFSRVGTGRPRPHYNDFIIYDPNQAQPRFAIKWNWDYLSE